MISPSFDGHRWSNRMRGRSELLLHIVLVDFVSNKVMKSGKEQYEVRDLTVDEHENASSQRWRWYL